SKEIGDFFHAAGFLILEGYGLTETTAAVTVNTPQAVKVGTVGKTLPGVEVRIAEDGEILVKGGVVFKGYYNKKEATQEAIDLEGWFHTGDIGEFDSEGFLKITDRKKELLKTSGGKYVAPAPIESKFREDFFVEQIMVVGEGKRFVSALIVPAFPVLEEWAKENNIAFTDRQSLISNSKVLAKIQSVVDELNPNFSHIEQIKKFKLLANEWTTETTELTPTMKLKRKVISAKYAKEIDEIYNN
ncbi:MAG: AMP-binding protein, partial [Bacteroidetes bacterium]|nr:AMP-binding protein [Bacteroidota bacterium]